MEIHDYHIKSWLKNKKLPSHMENIRFANFVDYDWYFKVVVHYNTSMNKNVILELTPERTEIESFIREQKIKNILEDETQHK